LRIERLSLEDFRNYGNETIDLAGGLNLVLGDNAQGKTNLLEAVYCLSGLGSPRSSDAALIREGSDSALIHAEVVKGDRRVQVDMEMRTGRGTRALINKTPVVAGKALGELVVGVFFGPDELSLVKGSPDGRRRFLDELVVKMRPAQHALRKEWDRVLRQRNALLRSLPTRGPGPETLDVWDEALCRVGASLAAARLAALSAMMPFARERYREIAGGGDLRLTYVSSWLAPEVAERWLIDPADLAPDVLSTALRARLDQVKPRELERRVSLVGPQRDDVMVKLASGADATVYLEARGYASQGDQRTAALALKLAEHDLLRETLSDDPILLLDDVLSELDPKRRSWLKGAVQGIEQTLLSSADGKTADELGGGVEILVRGGRVVSS
jgi:DNA replication and repair protein RecF